MKSPGILARNYWQALGKVTRRIGWQLGLWWAVLAATAGPIRAETMPPSLDESAREPVRYVGNEPVDKRYHHGGLRQAVGVHRYQAFRANRTRPVEEGSVGYTYNHQPYLAYWNGQFYLQFLSDLKEEHNPPGRTHLVTSTDGQSWSDPRVIFPVYPLPAIDGDVAVPAGTPAVMHQRMGFYLAPNGRLLTLAFYGYCPTPRHAPNKGNGLGRVVREIYDDGSCGRIYFIRYNRHAGWNETNTRYPHYRSCPDSGFVEACTALLADKLRTLQWYEEDRADDGFFTIRAIDDELKALSFYHRPDGVVVALWKRQWSALSADEGKSWTTQVPSPTLSTCGGKVWGQRTEDGRYALVYDHSASRRNRFPLAIMTGADGHTFDQLLCLHGEVPPARYQGIHKALGPQYIRGITEGNGDPPGGHLWNTYSMNKEDIWVARTRVPVTGIAERHVEEDFEGLTDPSNLETWNLYVPLWAPTSIVADPFDQENRCLQLLDEAPYDYARAERIIPESRTVSVRMRICMAEVGHGLLVVELQDRRGRRPLRLRFDPEWLALDFGKIGWPPIRVAPRRWLDLRIDVDCAAATYDLALDGRWATRGVPFQEQVDTVERLVFRTGPWRSDVRPYIVDGEPDNRGLYFEDRPGADRKIAKSVFLVDDVRTAEEIEAP